MLHALPTSPSSRRNHRTVSRCDGPRRSLRWGSTMRTLTRLFPSAAALATTTLLALACDPEPAGPAEGTDLDARAAVGAIDSTDLSLAALLDEDALTVYMCGGDETFDSHTRWFRGSFGEGDDPDAFELVSDGMTLVGTRTADGLTGELVEADGSRHAFAIDPVDDDSDLGLYFASQDDRNTGVVVREEGGELVAQGASCTRTNECNQVIILPPLAITNKTIQVQVEFDTGSTEEILVAHTLIAPTGI